MAFKLENFHSDTSNAKSTLGGVCYYRYDNADSDDYTEAGYFPNNLGLKVGDRIVIIPEERQFVDILAWVSDITDGVIKVEDCVSE